ncbi:hypothetical protein PHAVU_008G162600 [Phaseolus vulgaris]|uniref:Uncharacterized protein n=1 Tax=Phaseolus vulgaris TaxID=3885 RepID=V7B5D8_PHAVU|nr:hypothetical protein PHAVU_008G162600g [Phaseolus vulgaris]ESW13039.1 hypothetical protein PHAVU_008G162600g [Phaseolus vulgaris]
MTKKDKIALLEKAHSAIVLNLGDIVPRQVSKDTTGLWTKLESLYMTESMVNRLYLKQALYSFKMSNDKNIDVQIHDEDQALLLLYAFFKIHDHFKKTLLYGRESLSLEEVQTTSNSKELNKRIDDTNEFQALNCIILLM